MDSALNLIDWAEVELRRSDVKCARRDAEMLFMDTFDARREDLYLTEDYKVAPQRLNLFRRYVKIRASRYPLQYILKKTEFMGLAFALEEGIFIPRPETELLVERIIEYIKSKKRKRINPVRDVKDTKARRKISNGINILDVGTGCGNIAISLTKNVTRCRIMTSDISDKALKVAAKNARFHGVKKKIKFIKSSLFDKISSVFYNYFDIIVSNPPYVRKKDIGELQPEILYEDVITLDGGADGLYFYKHILNDGLKYLKKGGIFIFEIGYDQAKDIARLIKDDNRFSPPKFFKDYSGHNRIVLIQNG